MIVLSAWRIQEDGSLLLLAVESRFESIIPPFNVLNKGTIQPILSSIHIINHCLTSLLHGLEDSIPSSFKFLPRTTANNSLMKIVS